MKNKYSVLMLLALVVSGCGFVNSSSTSKNSSTNNQHSSNETSSSSSSVVNDSSSIKTSSSSSSINTSSSSSSIDKTGWIEENDEEYAISNPKKWFYKVDDSKVNVTNAMFFEDDKMLYFDFNGNGNYNDANLYYHDTYVLVGETYTTSFSITSNVAGKITVNDKEFDVKVGTSEVSVERKLIEGNATISIQFGAKDNAILAEEVCIEIGDVNISKITNVKARLDYALSINNYTISLKVDDDTFSGTGYYGEFKFFEKAVYYSYGNIHDAGNKETKVGYFENETGIFSYSINNNDVNVGSSYYLDSNGSPIKGLYTTNELIHRTEFTGDKNKRKCEGIPSLHKIDVSQFDFDLRIGESATLKDDDSLRYLSYMLDEEYPKFYYAGIMKGKVSLNSNDDIEINFVNGKGINPSTFIISNIGTTKDELVEEFVNGDSFFPEAVIDELPADPVVENMLTKINEGNYTITKPDGTKFYMNSEYSYMETKNSETNEIEVSGYLKAGPSMFAYKIQNDEIIVDTSLDYTGLYLGLTSISGLDGLTSISGLDGFNISNVQFFLLKNANKYSFNSEKDFYEYTNKNDVSYSLFARKWLNEEVNGYNYVSLKENNENIIIGIELIYEDNNSVYKTLEVSNIGSTNVKKLDDYLASFSEA